MKTTNYLISAGIILICLGSCHKIEKLPAIPSIEYTSFSIFDTTDILGNKSKGGRLRFRFQDGDGDLGLPVVTDSLADSTNLFFTLYRKINGVITLAPANDPLKPASYRIPYMYRQGQNKILKGTISVTFLYLFYNQGDTIRYDFYLKDRALNSSNIASTNDIIIAVNNTYK